MNLRLFFKLAKNWISEKKLILHPPETRVAKMAKNPPRDPQKPPILTDFRENPKKHFFPFFPPKFAIFCTFFLFKPAKNRDFWKSPCTFRRGLTQDFVAKTQFGEGIERENSCGKIPGFWGSGTDIFVAITRFSPVGKIAFFWKREKVEKFSHTSPLSPKSERLTRFWLTLVVQGGARGFLVTKKWPDEAKRVPWNVEKKPSCKKYSRWYNSAPSRDLAILGGPLGGSLGGSLGGRFLAIFAISGGTGPFPWGFISK